MHEPDPSAPQKAETSKAETPPAQDPNLVTLVSVPPALKLPRIYR